MCRTKVVEKTRTHKLMQARSWLPGHSVVFPAETFEIRKRLFILFSVEAEIEHRRNIENLWAVCLQRHNISKSLCKNVLKMATT